ncbi:MAG: BtpA/SgcQ family protein [Acidobacteriota bacterium]|nr:BtpA/SgcQ family protein [Acidobacteriota bacterium]MDQ7087579.1 BtpA/SgcQ family protein [Acidobacteriota bacterium]
MNRANRFFRRRPDAAPRLVGMLHLPALPGAPGHAGGLELVRQRMLADARALAEGGADALLLENFGDTPFHPGPVPPPTVAHMTALAVRLAEATDLPFGINVLRNDALAALAIAHATGASFIRVNVLCGVRVSDQGLLEGRAHELLRERQRLGAESIAIVADLDVKHSAPLAPRDLLDEAREILYRAGADALVLSGRATGAATDAADFRRLREALPEACLVIGSGVTPSNAAEYDDADALIVGSALKSAPGDPIDAGRVRRLVQALR